MKLTPLHDWVLIRIGEPSGKTTGGIIIPDSAQEEPEEGEVLAVGGGRYGEGRPPSAEQMAEMGKDINSKLSALLAKYDLTVDEYKGRSKEVFADDAAVKGYLAEHPDLKKRYEALPFDRMGRGGSSGRGY